MAVSLLVRATGSSIPYLNTVHENIVFTNKSDSNLPHQYWLKGHNMLSSPSQEAAEILGQIAMVR